MSRSGAVCAAIQASAPVVRWNSCAVGWCALEIPPALSCSAVVCAAQPPLPHSWLPCTARAFPRISPPTGLLRGNGLDHVNQRAETVILTPGCKNDAKSVSAFGGRESILFFSHTNPRAAGQVQAHEPGGPCGPAFAARRAYERGTIQMRVGLLRHSGWRQQATVSPKLRLPTNSPYHNITVHVAYPLEQRSRPPASVAIGCSVFTARAREAGSQDLSRSGLKAAGGR